MTGVILPVFICFHHRSFIPVTSQAPWQSAVKRAGGEGPRWWLGLSIVPGFSPARNGGLMGKSHGKSLKWENHRNISKLNDGCSRPSMTQEAAFPQPMAGCYRLVILKRRRRGEKGERDFTTCFLNYVTHIHLWWRLKMGLPSKHDQICNHISIYINLYHNIFCRIIRIIYINIAIYDRIWPTKLVGSHGMILQPVSWVPFKKPNRENLEESQNGYFLWLNLRDTHGYPKLAQVLFLDWIRDGRQARRRDFRMWQMWDKKPWEWSGYPGVSSRYGYMGYVKKLGISQKAQNNGYPLVN